MKCDFSGYATKSNVKCSDGRIIMQDAFSDCDGKKVPIVWQHLHNDPANVLGHGILENRKDGVYIYGFFNDSEAAKNAKALIVHGDVEALSIYANGLVQKGFNVMHGVIREVSMVLSGANPGAYIDNISFAHADGSVTDVDDEAIIYGGELSHEDADDSKKDSNPSATADENKKKKTAEGNDKTIGEIWQTLTEEQENAVYAVIAQLMGEDEEEESESESTSEAKQSAIEDESEETEDTLTHSEGDGTVMKKNIFDNSATGQETEEQKKVSEFLSHDGMKATFDDARQCGSFRQAFLAHAQSYGVSNVEALFPTATAITNEPEFITRNMDWVEELLNACRHLPYEKIKSTFADLTADEARARGYVKGAQKFEEVFPVMARETDAQTIYKKQKADRDDILAITDFSYVNFIRKDMRMMLREELARAIVVGDGRNVSSADKIKEDRIRPVWKDDVFYTLKTDISTIMASASDNLAKSDAILDAFIQLMEDYRGRGNLIGYVHPSLLRIFLLARDKMGHRLYKTNAEVAAALGVSTIRRCDPMRDVRGTAGSTVTAPLVIAFDPKDYAIGTNRGGEITSFEDFDIDYNQYKYLLESRCSGALTGHHSALVLTTGFKIPSTETESSTKG